MAKDIIDCRCWCCCCFRYCQVINRLKIENCNDRIVSSTGNLKCLEIVNAIKILIRDFFLSSSALSSLISNELSTTDCECRLFSLLECGKWKAKSKEGTLQLMHSYHSIHCWIRISLLKLFNYNPIEYET